MQVQLCTFEIKLESVSFPPNSKTEQIEAVWRSDKGQVIIVGAVRPVRSKGQAIFNEAFEITTDLLRDPQSELYSPNTIILQIRRANQPMHAKVSGSICHFNLAQILNNGPLPQKQHEAENGSFTVNLTIKCDHIKDTGIKRTVRRNPQTRSNMTESTFLKGRNGNQIQRQPHSQLEKRSLDTSRSKGEAHKSVILDKQIENMKADLEKQRSEHLLTRQQLKKTESQVLEHQQIINQLSAVVTQRETDIIDLSARLIPQPSLSLPTELANQNEQLLTKLEFKLVEKEKRIDQLEKALVRLQESYHSTAKSENFLNEALVRIEKSNFELREENEANRKRVKSLQAEKQALLQAIKAAEEQRQKFQSGLVRWKEEMGEYQRAKNLEMAHLQTQYRKLYAQYNDLLGKVKETEGMIQLSQMQQMQQDYQERLNQYAEKEATLRQNMEIVEQEMVNLEQMLQQKQENQQILIDHAKRLQHDLDAVNFNSNWWITVLTKEMESPTRVNGSPRRNEQQEEVSALKERIKKLLRILQQSSHNILESEKNKRQVARLQKYQQQILSRYAQVIEETKEVKQKLSIMLKENKKLLEKNTKFTKEIQKLSKEKKRLTKDLNESQKKEMLLQEQYDILNYHSSLLEKEVKETKLLVSQAQKDAENQKEEVPKSPQKKNQQQLLPLPLIYENNFEDSASFSLKVGNMVGTQFYPQQMGEVFASQLSALLNERTNMMEKLLVQIAESGEGRKVEAEAVHKAFKQVQVLANQFKLALIRSGKKDTIATWHTAVSRLKNQVHRLL